MTGSVGSYKQGRDVTDMRFATAVGQANPNMAAPTFGEPLHLHVARFGKLLEVFAQYRISNLECFPQLTKLSPADFLLRSTVKPLNA